MKIYSNNEKPSIPIYIINLKQDNKKRQHMETLLEALGLQYHMIEAIDGTILDSDQIEKVYSEREAINKIGRRLTLPEIGTALSHLSIYRTIIEEQIDIALILEDDVEIEPSLPSVLASLDALPKHWDLILLGHHPERSLFIETNSSHWQQTDFDAFTKCIRFSEFPYGAYGYLINQSGSRKLLHALERIREPIDQYTGDETLINVYGISPVCIKVHSALLKESQLSKERDHLNAMILKMPSRSVQLLKKIPFLVKSIRVSQRFVKRYFKKSEYKA